MGCLSSKTEVSDLHPNIFLVQNIDEHGSSCRTWQLQVTDTDLILYSPGGHNTVWPLHSLRRYGFEEDTFSFESGRRCNSGEGIYAFKCRRAPQLFQTLQQQILLRNSVHENIPYPVPGLSPLPAGRPTLQASVVHRSSVDNGQPDNFSSSLNFSHLSMPLSGIMRNGNLGQSHRSPSSADILEVTPLYPQSRNNTNHGANVYQLQESKKENNNNQSEIVPDFRHEYSNDLSRDLAILRHTLKRETALNTMRDMEYETRFLQNRYINDKISKNTESDPLSPTLSTSSEHYAQLSMDQQNAPRLYVNIITNENNLQEINKAEAVPTTPLTPKPAEYCNIAPSSAKFPESNTYANLLLSDKVESVKSVLLNSSEPNNKFSESDTLTSMSPVEELEVNYAVLDIDSTKEAIKTNMDVSSPENHSFNSSKTEVSTSCSSQSRARLVSQNSIEKVPTTIVSTSVTTPSVSIGYTTIDFDKTVALTSVAEDPRKTRHNSSSKLCGSPINSSNDKSRNN